MAKKWWWPQFSHPSPARIDVDRFDASVNSGALVGTVEVVVDGIFCMNTAIDRA